MAEEVDLQRLIVSFEANQKQFNSQLEKIDRKLSGATKSMNRSLGKTSLAAEALTGVFRAMVPAITVTGLVQIGKNALDTADKIDKLAISTGLSRERIQTLSFAAEQLGVGADTATAGFERFSRRLGEFKNSGAGPAKDALEELGLANKILAGELPNTEAELDAVLKALSRVEGQQRQAALSAKLFGDEVGPKMSRFLAEGVEGISKYEQELRDLGGVMDDELIRKSVEARDELNRFFTVVEAKSAIFAASVIQDMKEVGNSIGDFVARMIYGADAVNQAIGQMNSNTGTGLDPNDPNLLPPPPPGPDISGLLTSSGLKSRDIAKLRGEIDTLRAALDSGTLSASETAEALEAIAAKEKKIADLNKSGSGNSAAQREKRDVLGQLNTELEREIRNLEFQATLVGKSEAEVSRLTAAHEKELALQDALAQAAEAGIALSPQQVEALRARLGAVEDLTVGLDNLNRLEEESKKAAEEVAQAQQDVANGALDAAEAIAAAAKGTQSWEEALIQLLRIFLQLQQSGALGMFFGGGGVTLSNSGNAFGAAGSLFNGNGSIALPGNSSGLGFLGSASQGLLGDYFGIGDIFGGLFGGFRASGGPVQAGRAYMVGENGPEPFIPSVPGRIVSRGQSSLMRSDPTQNITFNVTTPDVIGFQRSKAAIAADLRRASRQAAGRG